MGTTRVWVCPVCAGQPRVVVAVAHRAMNALIVDLLLSEHGCWAVSAIDGATDLDEAVSAHPDLVVVDAADFTVGRDRPLDDFPLHRVVVIGPEPGDGYRQVALRGGAGAWLSRDDVAEDLSAALRSALGCLHRPCPQPVG